MQEMKYEVNRDSGLVVTPDLHDGEIQRITMDDMQTLNVWIQNVWDDHSYMLRLSGTSYCLCEDMSHQNVIGSIEVTSIATDDPKLLGDLFSQDLAASTEALEALSQRCSSQRTQGGTYVVLVPSVGACIRALCKQVKFFRQSS